MEVKEGMVLNTRTLFGLNTKKEKKEKKEGMENKQSK
jgi:hypothetical protein